MAGWLAGWLASRPAASQPASQPACRPASQPASQPVSQPANHPASQPITHLISATKTCICYLLQPHQKRIREALKTIVKINCLNQICILEIWLSPGYLPVTSPWPAGWCGWFFSVFFLLYFLYFDDFRGPRMHETICFLLLF